MKKPKTKKAQPKDVQLDKIGRYHFTVRERMFNQIVLVFLNWSHADFVQWALRRGATSEYKNDPDYDRNFAAFTTTISQQGTPDKYAICMGEFKWSCRDQGYLVHEITHVVMSIWQLQSIPVTKDTEEFLATAIGNLYTDIAWKIYTLEAARERRAKARKDATRRADAKHRR